MTLTRSLMAALLATALGLGACAAGGPKMELSNSGLANDLYPTPSTLYNPYLGLEEGLITRDWDGGYPLRFIAYLLHPLGVVADLGINQLGYLAAAQDPELSGYTNQDELYRRSFQKQRYSWDTFYYQHQQASKADAPRSGE